MSGRKTGEGSLRICLTGGWFESSNVGDNAILAGLTDSIREKGKADFSVFTAAPERAARVHGLRAISPRRDPLALVRALWVADALGFTGGTPFYDGLKHMAYLGLLAMIARLRGIPIFILGISLRAMKNPLCRKLARFICRAASYSGAREEVTRLALDRLIGREGRSRILPDPGTQMRPAASSWAKDEAKFLIGNGRGPRVAVCLRDLGSPSSFRAAHFGQSYSPQDIARLLSAVAGLCTHLIEKHRARVVFLPMHTESPDDDRVPARDCARLIQDAKVLKRVHLVERQYGPREMKALLGSMDAVVGMRFHSLVLSASMGVPNYALGYAAKNAALMDFLGRETYFQPVREIDAGRLEKGVGALFAALPEQRRALARRNNVLNAQYAAELKIILRLARWRG
jgi:polysaccharide pyruvyl transferase WcaK-like protein